MKQYSILGSLSNTKNCDTGEFPGGPVVKTLLFQRGGSRVVVFQIPAQGTRIPQALMHSQKKKLPHCLKATKRSIFWEKKNNKRIALFQARQHTKAMNVQRGIYVPINKAILQAKVLS